jgi:hypothetical protein
MAPNHGRKLKSAKELHSGPFLACPKMYDLCAPNPLSRSVSSSDIYLTGGRFVGNHLSRFVSFSRCWESGAVKGQIRLPDPNDITRF